MIFDTHAHYDDPIYDPDRAQLFAELKANDSEMMRPFGAPVEVLHGCRQLVP